MLVTLEDKPYANMTIPGKVQSYMAVGKPVIGAINGSCSNFIVNNNIGYAVKSGDSQALADLIRELSVEDLKQIGIHSREVYFKKYSKKLFMDKLLFTLNQSK